ncbi:MAG: phosphoenolpyruvate synthase [Legionellales bacterium RIFCSPHIGHO2_12_FULL_37_14]|nr:MAG: phosphoenolpyruvate synthase [Legionellales bacterium RIFCSPHIGHO2_12_FULL_37_14]
MPQITHTLFFEKIGMQDLGAVGGKNSSLGEMICHLTKVGVKVPQGFATTADAFNEWMQHHELDKKIASLLNRLDIEDLTELTKVGKTIRQSMLDAPLLPSFETSLRTAYQELAAKIGRNDFSVAVRSSATAEDLPDASFAGQQETFLNVNGFTNVLHAIKHVFASLYNDRAITYRIHHGFLHDEVAISAGVQQMVRSDLGASGVLFTIDTESGFDEVVFITASYGLGELIVQGAVNPDEYIIYKPALRNSRPAILSRRLGSKLIKMVYKTTNNPLKQVETLDVEEQDQRQFALTSQEAQDLAKQALLIEAHYGRPMDIEWAKDGATNEIYILQARPETVKSRNNSQLLLERYELKEKGTVIIEGRSIGQKIGQGKARIIKDLQDMANLKKGDVLITDMTDPDWEPVMKRAAAIVTNRGGRTCHAAIIARELGIPAVVGTGDATKKIQDGTDITVSCAEGETGYVYKDKLLFERTTLDMENFPSLPLKIMLNVGNPERAFTFRSIPNCGVGLARVEFIISNSIGIHPRALLDFDKLTDKEVKAQILAKVSAYESPVAYYVERLKEGIATLAAAFYPNPVIVRLSDFKSNEYANLLAGKLYEPEEENPMLGFRGAIRYVDKIFKDCFALECKAIRLAREEMGLDNVQVMVPFVRTVGEAERVIEALKENGLERNKAGLKLIMMCEIPSNALLAEEFLRHFDGFSIGSNDLTQLTLGLDRDSGLVASLFDERNAAVKKLLHLAITACKKEDKYIGICGQGPSDHEDFAAWLMEEGIDSVSLNPDSVLATCLFLAKEAKV